MNLSFLSSVRFWKLFVVAGLVALQTEGYVTGELYNALATLLELWLGGSVVVKTIDRAADKLGG